MPLSQGFQRLLTYLAPEIDKMLQRQQARFGSYDRAEFDGATQLASIWRGQSLVWRGKAEHIGYYAASFGMLRWWWHGGISNVRRGRLDTVLDEARKHQIRELSADHAEVATEAEARKLAELVAQLAHADGILRIESEEFGVQFLAVFDAARSSAGDVEKQAREQAAKYTVPAPASTGEPLARARSRVQTISGAEQVIAVPLPVREPTREVVGPLVKAALEALARMEQGFLQAMVTVVVEMKDSKGRFTVQLVAVDGASELVALDTSRELSEAAAQMIAEDARTGNGRWGKLVVKLRRTQRGASVEVSVVA